MQCNITLFFDVTFDYLIIVLFDITLLMTDETRLTFRCQLGFQQRSAYVSDSR